MHAFVSNLAHRQTNERAFTSSFVGGKNDSKTKHDIHSTIYKVKPKVAYTQCLKWKIRGEGTLRQL